MPRCGLEANTNLLMHSALEIAFYLRCESYMAMSRILLKLAERSLPSMLLRDFQLFVKNSVMQLV
jgi:hypothetical protein